MSTSKRLYETTFIVNASLDDPQIDGVIARVQDTITKNGGTITALNKWGRKRLTYSINKKTTGFYVNIEFEAPGTVLGLLERSFQLDEMILRDLTIVLDAKALAARKASQLALQAQQIQMAAEAAAAPQTREPLFTEQPGESR
jgi:small subunit ribosomal protein S6